MSLYGSLFSSVAGLRAQSNKVGVISDNISNVNTVGYKQGQASFETLVTSSGIASIYSPGGVLSSNRALVSKQGLIQGTDNGTDIAISGSGFFVVKNNTTEDAQVFYTRAGSFRQDSLGNFRNAAGFYLQGWPLDREGRLPGEPGNLNTNSANNLTSLERVNLLAATGAAAETTSAAISANLKSSQTVYPGAKVTADMDTATPNANIPSKSIIVPGYLNGSALSGNINSIERGDKFTVEQGNGLSNTYRYGGFTFSRDVTTAANGDSELGLIISPQTLVSNPVATVNNSTTVTVTAPNHGLAAGDVVTLSGFSAAVNGIPAADLNQKFVVQSVASNTFTITVASQATSTGSSGGSSVSLATRSFAGNILDASSATQRFLATTGTSGFSTAALSFSITSTSVGTVSFTYTNGTPNSQQKQFNTLENLATAINTIAGLSARVSGGRLYVGSTDANEAVTFTNGEEDGDDSGTTVLAGIDWVRELGLENITTGQDRFNSLDTLDDLIQASAGLDSVVKNQFTQATLDLNIEDPLDTISLTDLPTAAALSSFASTTPFGTTINSKVVSITHPSPHGLSTGDVVEIDPTGFTGYPAAFSATNVFATTNASATVTITQAAHGFTTGDVVHIDPTTLSGWPSGTINGIPMQAFQGNFTVTVLTANTYTITAATAATSTGNAGGGTLTVSPTLNGIPMTDLNGRFEVTVTGPSTYTINVAHAATSTGNTGQAGLVVTPPNNRGSLLAELGLVDSLGGATYSVQTLGPNGPQYNPTDADYNMAGGNITAQFSQNLRVYDSLGTPHDLKVSFIKTDANTWAAEIYAADTDEVSSTYSNGQVATGTVVFNGDGSLRSVSTGLSNPIAIVWSNGAKDSSISVNWGTAGEPFGTVGATAIGKTDGMTQFDSSYRVNFFNQNGAAVGQLVSVSFNEEGFVIANYNNGESQKLYRLPIADFSNPDQLNTSSGNVFTQTNESGEPNLREPGVDGAGKLQSSALETSNVELADQLTDLIVAQRAYQANTKVVTTASDLLDTLNQAIR